MALLSLVLLCFLNASFGKDCLINNMSEQMAWEIKLREDLKCDYRVLDPPPTNTSDPFIVGVTFLLESFTFDSAEEIFKIQSKTTILWSDERLKWDPAEYFGIDTTEMSTADIWSPSLRLYNNADSFDLERFFLAQCRLESTGDIMCTFPTTREAFCSVKLTNWPYDVQECTLEFGIWTSKWITFRMIFSTPAINIDGEYGTKWFIRAYRQVDDYSSERQLKMTFVLERGVDKLTAMVVYPSGILTALNVTCFFLDVRRRVRLGVAYFSLLSHYYFLAELALHIPKQSVSPPTILLYYGGSVIVTVTIILSTFMLAGICKLKSTPQSYIVSINEFVYESYGRYLVFPRWAFDDDTADKRFNEVWTKFANVGNCVFMFIIAITYISLYSLFMPKPVSVK